MCLLLDRVNTCLVKDFLSHFRCHFPVIGTYPSKELCAHLQNILQQKGR